MMISAPGNVSIRLLMLLTLASFIFSCSSRKEQVAEPPNIIFIFIDDMGYGDLGCYGNTDVHTPHIDQLAAEGIRLNQFYVNAPICSPSRVAVTTGQYPSRWGITTFISGRSHNEARGIRDYLHLSAPSVARELQQNGYYTAHIGKWHMGGGRDVHDAPLVTEYGFNESVTQFEGLGERYLATYETLHLEDSTRSLEKRSAALGFGPVHWAKRENFTKIFVDRTIDAIENARREDKPFYINLWPDDIHTPLEPPAELRGDLSTKARFLGVMEEMDRQFGRLFNYIREYPSLHENTLIIFTSDNGPDAEVNTAGHLRGVKTNLYEGGFREPFIAWWPSVIPQEKNGSVNERSVVAGFDLPLIFLTAAGADINDSIAYDGENMFDAIAGIAEPMREKPLFWMRPPDRPGYNGDNDPDLAVRKGPYKLLMDADGSNLQLYNILSDEIESNDLSHQLPEIASELESALLDWYHHYPHTIDTTKITY